MLDPTGIDPSTHRLFLDKLMSHAIVLLMLLASSTSLYSQSPYPGLF